jgi:glutaredoxin-like protein NrdH
MKVYSKKKCVQCDATFRRLDKAGVEYEVIKVDEDPAALEYILALGAQAAPVIVLDSGEWFSGYRPDVLDRAIAKVSA